MKFPMLARGSFVAALLAATPGLCFAAGEAGQKADVLAPNLVNSIVTLVVFGGLLAVLYKFAWPGIIAGLAAREDAQFRALNDAKLAREEAEAMRGKLTQEMDAAAARIKGMLDEARRDAEVLRAEQREVGIKEAQAERDRARKEIQTEKSVALQEIYQQAVQLASMMSAKTIRRQLSSDDHRRLLDESLAELRGKA